MAELRAIHGVVVLLVTGFALMGISNLILSQKLEDEMAKSRACPIMQMPLPYLVCTAIGALTIGLLAAKTLVIAVQYLYPDGLLYGMRGGMKDVTKEADEKK